ncbi:MAG: hypothetical protein CMG57_06925 [Candidatus Marinimicrobia bacterium]|nr:hypothetical protein [Candidatus Neomarinimicrobiota bacterium]
MVIKLKIVSYKIIFQLLYFICLWSLFSYPLLAVFPFDKKNISQNVPNKDWTDHQYLNYYKLRDRMLLKQINEENDPQILRRQKAILNGNKITSEIWNYGSISSPGNRVTDIVWEGLGYGYEFGPFICAEVEVEPESHLDAYVKIDENGDPVINNQGDTVWVARIISDGLVSLGGEVSPDGKEVWGWQPLAFNSENVPYADSESNYIPTSNDFDRDGDGKPDSWPDGWYNEILKEYKWPGALSQGASNSDMESFFVVDDRTNKEFEYYPFPDDSSRKGLGIEIESRYYQWSNPMAEDIIFLIYKVTNKSEKDLKEVIFGMWGDPHIGGPSNWQDDLSFFDRDINMVYCWDEDGYSDVSGRDPGYFGYKFLESPGEPYDGIDNDMDGMIDESRSDGIDNDGDWDPEKHDVGVDGLQNTGDRGEGDGIPTAGDQYDIREPGEPNFEWTDLDEADMMGLTGFASPAFGGNNSISNDNYVFQNFLTPGVFDSANANSAGDYIFIYSSGPIDLPAGEARRFSIALLVGQNYEDLTLNALTAQSIYERNYQFAKPPEKPNLTAVPGNEKVTLYWDDIAEYSIDPISDKNDFEGYVIYRSTDPQFLDQQTITDAYGSNFLFTPLEQVGGAPAKFDLINDYSGLSSIPYTGHGIPYNLGSNTGIQHSFVDSNNVINGQVYYYTVVSYDHGDDSLLIAPAECSKLITLNPESNELFLDINTAQVVPRVPSAGYTAGNLTSEGIFHQEGTGTGNVRIEIIDPMKIEDSDTFRVTFKESPTRYSVEDTKPVEEIFIANYGKFIGLKYRNILKESFTLKSMDGTVTYIDSVDYELDSDYGRIRAVPDTAGGNLQNGIQYQISYTHFAIKDSKMLNDEESNPVFDGLKIFVQDEPLEIDDSKTGWNLYSPTNYAAVVGVFSQGGTAFPADYEVRFSSTIIDTGSFAGILTPFEIYKTTMGMIPEKQRFAILKRQPNESNDTWDSHDEIVLFEGDGFSSPTWMIKFLQPPEDTPIVPTDGDIYHIATSRPFTTNDLFTFITSASRIDENQFNNDLEKIAVVPNPYVVTNALERLDRQNPRDRGPRRLYFNHLPAKCTIRIYTITGELVKSLVHNSTIDDGKEYWDLTTSDNFPIAYGVYIFHVDAGELGEKIGRFAVIK